MPAQAGRILKERTVENQKQWLETVATTMSAAGMYDKAGEFYEEMDQLQRAMDRCCGRFWAFLGAVVHSDILIHRLIH